MSGFGVFNGGLVVYSWTGVAVGASSPSAERAGPAPGDEPSRLLAAVQTTLRPAFSDVFQDPLTGEDVILVGVPIRGLDGEFGGMLAGVAKLRTSLLGVVFAEVLERGRARSR